MNADDGLLDLENQFCFALYSAARNVVRAYTEELKSLGLTYPQYLVMLVLWEWHRAGFQRPTVKALGARLGTDSGTLSPVLKRLQEKGLVNRTRAVSTRESTADERELYVSVTSAGLRLKRQARKVPLKMLELSPISVEELMYLRDRLAQFRSSHAAA